MKFCKKITLLFTILVTTSTHCSEYPFIEEDYNFYFCNKSISPHSIENPFEDPKDLSTLYKNKQTLSKKKDQDNFLLFDEKNSEADSTEIIDDEFLRDNSGQNKIIHISNAPHFKFKKNKNIIPKHSNLKKRKKKKKRSDSNSKLLSNWTIPQLRIKSTTNHLINVVNKQIYYRNLTAKIVGLKTESIFPKMNYIDKNDQPSEEELIIINQKALDSELRIKKFLKLYTSPTSFFNYEKIIKQLNKNIKKFNNLAIKVERYNRFLIKKENKISYENDKKKEQIIRNSVNFYIEKNKNLENKIKQYRLYFSKIWPKVHNPTPRKNPNKL